MKLYFKLLAVSFAIFIACPVYAQPDSGKVLANVMVRDAERTGIIVVDKNNKRLFDIRAEGNGFSIASSYDVIYGINQGDKSLSGDGKTPEGVYYITEWRSSESLIKAYGRYAEIYGGGSFPLNYPNPVDKIRKKTGHGIWIHGRDPIKGKDTTQGCVALRNDDLSTLKASAPLKNPVIITEKTSFITKDEYEKEREALFTYFDGFIKSWRNGDYETFKNYVHPDYYGAGKKADSYLANKKHLMKIYPDKVIEISNTKILRQNGANLIVDTDQFYCAKNLTTYGNKKYYFTESGGVLKLISEEVSSANPSGIIEASVKEFLNSWVAAWQSKNVENYIKYYSNDFINGKMDLKNWHSYKESIFQKPSNISVEISDIRWSAPNNVYTVSFTQKYTSGQVSDMGTKTLVFEGCPGNFKIISETWNAN